MTVVSTLAATVIIAMAAAGCGNEHRVRASEQEPAESVGGADALPLTRPFAVTTDASIEVVVDPDGGLAPQADGGLVAPQADIEVVVDGGAQLAEDTDGELAEDADIELAEDADIELAGAASSSCVGSGTQAAINARLVGVGATAVLCPRAVFSLFAPVRFTAANQRIVTQGLPRDASRARLVITGAGFTTAIDGVGRSGIKILNVVVDGNRGSMARLTGPALIRIGGNASGQVVKWVDAKHTRSWSTIHVAEGTVINNLPSCQGAYLAHNVIGPAGFSSQDQWADGISLACGNSIVTNNRIQDATDGGIVIFGAPASIVQHNTVVASSRVLLGGINLVDYLPVAGNYTGTRVIANTIDGSGAFIKVGIAMGPAVWFSSSDRRIVYAATVSNNVLKGKHMGYGYAVDGVSSFSVTGNVSGARHVGVASPGNSPPAPFLAGYVSHTHLQGEFQPGRLSHAIGVTEPAILAVIRPPSGCGRLTADQGLVPGESIYSCTGNYRLSMQHDGNIVQYETRYNRPVWASHTELSGTIQLIMQGDGNLVAYDGAGRPKGATHTHGNPGAWFAVQDDGNMVVYSADHRALWASAW